MRGLVAAVVLGLGAGQAGAQVGGNAAAADLFAPDRAAIVFADGVRLSRADRRALEGVVVAAKFYGAIAFAPDRGLMSEATAAAQNYHSTEAADAAALAECRAKSGGAACVVAARLVPEGYAPRGTQMPA